MADTYDVIICGAGSAGGFMAGEIAAHGSVLILDAGPFYPRGSKSRSRPTRTTQAGDPGEPGDLAPRR